MEIVGRLRVQCIRMSCVCSTVRSFARSNESAVAGEPERINAYTVYTAIRHCCVIPGAMIL